MKFYTLKKIDKVTKVLLAMLLAALLIGMNIIRGPIADMVLEEGILKCNVGMVEWSLALGANPRAVNEYHVSYLGEATSKGNRKIVEILLVHGADPDVRDYLGRPSKGVISDPAIVKLLQDAMQKGKK